MTFNPFGTNSNYRYSVTATLTNYDVAQKASNSLVNADPKTPIFPAEKGQEVRMRLLTVGGGNGDGANNQVVFVDGHGWQEEPYINDSTEIGDNPFSNYFGSQQVLSWEPVNMVLGKAGGDMQASGDYSFGEYNLGYARGAWGLIRVSEQGAAVVINSAQTSGSDFVVSGSVSADPNTGAYASTVDINILTAQSQTIELEADVQSDGTWSASTTAAVQPDSVVTATVDGGSNLNPVVTPYPAAFSPPVYSPINCPAP